MHASILAVLALCVAASILQATDARTPAGMATRRQLGSYKDYRHHPHKHDHDPKKHHRHDKDHSHYRRRLEDMDAKTTESSDYSYGKDDHGHDVYGHDVYGHDVYDYGYDAYGYKHDGYKNKHKGDGYGEVFQAFTEMIQSRSRATLKLRRGLR
ncbi:hypothetical protein PC115_g25316 [Phytophthora cactorum]|uniref:RxLR effector protein n=1 Tax=Phytophthora cactorum TaxID=29920 RepID=A0A8T1A4N6_9STRA|nr:hypothetical protein PC115_g25316 [Phytophthora cactorum]